MYIPCFVEDAPVTASEALTIIVPVEVFPIYMPCPDWDVTEPVAETVTLPLFVDFA